MGARSGRYRGDHRTRLAEQKIPSNRSCSAIPTASTQRRAKKPSPVPVILITYATHEDAVYRALEQLSRTSRSGRPQVIRIEKN